MLQVEKLSNFTFAWSDAQFVKWMLMDLMHILAVVGSIRTSIKWLDQI